MINHIGRFLKNQIERLIALSIPTFIVAPLVIYAEVRILGIGLKLASLKILCMVAIILGAYVWEKITERTRAHFLGNSENRLIKWIADGLAASVFKIPIFWVCVFLLWAFGYPIPIRNVAILSLIYLSENMLIVGGLSGIAIDWLHQGLPGKVLGWLRYLLRRIRNWARLQYNVFPEDT